MGSWSMNCKILSLPSSELNFITILPNVAIWPWFSSISKPLTPFPGYGLQSKSVNSKFMSLTTTTLYSAAPAALRPLNTDHRFAGFPFSNSCWNSIGLLQIPAQTRTISKRGHNLVSQALHGSLHCEMPQTSGTWETPNILTISILT